MWKKISICLASFTLSGFISLTNAIQVFLPKDSPSDSDHISPDIVTGTTKLTDIIFLVNKYLRFAIGFVCFLFMIWNGYQLIIARGDNEQMKKATKALTGCAIGLVTCLLAYIIVNIAIKFFQ